MIAALGRQLSRRRRSSILGTFTWWQAVWGTAIASVLVFSLSSYLPSGKSGSTGNDGDADDTELNEGKPTAGLSETERKAGPGRKKTNPSPPSTEPKVENDPNLPTLGKPAPAKGVGGKTFSKPMNQMSAGDIAGKYYFNGQYYTLTESTAQGLINASKRTGFPVEPMLPAFARESGLKADAYNKLGALGLSQQMTTKSTPTLYENTYKYAKKYGFPEAANLVEQFVSKKDKKGNPTRFSYRPVNNSAKKELHALALTAEFNATMFGASKIGAIEAYQEFLGTGRAITVGEIVAMNNLGLGGMKYFFSNVLEDKRTGKDRLAIDFFRTKETRKVFGGGDVGAHNRTLIYDGKRKLTLRESYNNLVNDFGGWGPVTLSEPQHTL